MSIGDVESISEYKGVVISLRWSDVLIRNVGRAEDG